MWIVFQNFQILACCPVAVWSSRIENSQCWIPLSGRLALPQAILNHNGTHYNTPYTLQLSLSSGISLGYWVTAGFLVSFSRESVLQILIVLKGEHLILDPTLVLSFLISLYSCSNVYHEWFCSTFLIFRVSGYLGRVH